MCILGFLCPHSKCNLRMLLSSCENEVLSVFIGMAAALSLAHHMFVKRTSLSLSFLCGASFCLVPTLPPLSNAQAMWCIGETLYATEF